SHELSKDAADLFQGQDLIQTLPKYVGSDGLIKSETDLGGYAELMQSENTFSHRLLLLKILVATLKSDGKFSGK
ncbi:MAG: hypothetical protein EBU93_08005, partial [Chlamydiae bacterium]|nr:hypothetical protein [Chlamydiota bacterium]